MPNSLRCKIKHLYHNGTLTERERDRILKALEQEPCEDAISRESLDNAISGLTYWHFENGRLITGGGGSKAETVYKVDDVMRLTHVLPSVTPQYTDAEIQKMQELEQAEIQKAYELGKASQPKTRSEQNV